MTARYVVGIDLGTTNSAVAWAALGADGPCAALPIPQLVQPGQVADRALLPSFLYLPGPGELPAGALALPWAPQRDFTVGAFARQAGAAAPPRLVSSAKSWLGHAGVDRRADILPWQPPGTTAPSDIRRVSPLTAITRYLQHLVEAWNQAHADAPLAQQDVVLTVPASFDAAARDLTLEAARAAGLPPPTLLEEPQAAFYAWLDAHADWRDRLRVGERVLVVDIGGGTTDFTLIEALDRAGELGLERVAVGDHLLLGGDNMDLALAQTAAQALGIKPAPAALVAFSHSCRQAKELLFADAARSAAPVTLLGRGSRVIGGTIAGELTRTQAETTLLDGFFPRCGPDDHPARTVAGGLQEIGLPFVRDPAITRHLAAFLARHPGTFPAAVLCNGGVFRAGPLAQRLQEVVQSWAPNGHTVRRLGAIDLEQAVARGAAYYGLVRRGRGVRVRGGTARAYYVGIETSRPAIPGLPPAVRALCIAPFGMEEGTAAAVPALEFGLRVGEEVEFRLLGSSVRKTDPAGVFVDDWEDDIEELAPVRATLDGPPGPPVPVHLSSRVTETGQLELFCVGRDGRRWQLAFNVR
jgi:molecular chaperone DnaK (HSP70)